MLERFLNCVLWLLIMSLITGTAMAALMFSYTGLARLCAAHYEPGGIAVVVGTAFGACSYLLCRNANDLIDR